MSHSIDHPGEGAVCERMALRIRGWAIPPRDVGNVTAVDVRIRGRTVSSTQTLLLREDVNRAYRLRADLRTGFELYLDLPDEPPGELAFELWLRTDAGREAFVATRRVTLAGIDYGQAAFAPLLSAAHGEVLHRHHIYTSGPPSPAPSAECVGMVLERIARHGTRRVVDVGCGIGAYAEPLRSAGFEWTGVEISPEMCAVLAAARLPHHLSHGTALPFADREFDSALCIEVLEHIDDCESFLAELSRVARETFFSVPNCELIPYYSRHLAVPWHLLEKSHVNFFSRWSLRSLLVRHYPNVEITAYGPAPVRSAEGAQLFYHLFAHATR